MSQAPAESDEIAQFRAEVRAWIADNCPEDPGFKLPQTFLEVESDQQFNFLREWQRKVFDAGFIGHDVPEEYGGRGVNMAKHRAVSQELNRARAPFLLNRIGLQWAGPTILSFGTEEQKKKYLAPLLRGDEIWCQGFSEPGAGSDLAGLSLKGEQTDTGWKFTGHKIWTTLAHEAAHMILLARTEPEAHKYKGISYFLFPMDAPGVTVQPLVKMTGEGGFNQVFFEDAPAPSETLLGARGQGWQLAMATLMFERGAQGGGSESASEYREVLRSVIAAASRARRDGKPAIDDPVLRDRLTQLWIEVEALALHGRRARVPALTADRPMALPLMHKLVFSEINQRLSELAVEMLGPESTLWLGDAHAPDGAQWPRAYMNSFGMTIGGGTSEILRNVLGERVLGLPKSK
jgi:alkylation response protein AidB-like acyl-CoA dehydrogenase